MPIYESMPVTVRLITEVDGHVLTFEETGKATGGRYHGADPAPYTAAETLESRVRGTADTNIARATAKAMRALSRLYPVRAPVQSGTPDGIAITKTPETEEREQ